MSEHPLGMCPKLVVLGLEVDWISYQGFFNKVLFGSYCYRLGIKFQKSEERCKSKSMKSGSDNS